MLFSKKSQRLSLLLVMTTGLALLQTGCSWLSLSPGPNPTSELAAVALESSTTNPHAWYLRGLDALERKDFKSSSKAFKKAIQLDDSFEEACIGLARSYSGSSKHRKAAETYSLVLEMNSKSVTAKEGLILSHLDLGDIDTAVSHTQRLFSANDTNAAANYALGLQAYASSQYLKALDHWRISVRDPRFRPALDPLLEDLTAYVAKYGESGDANGN